jgi:hypothetical protein
MKFPTDNLRLHIPKMSILWPQIDMVAVDSVPALLSLIVTFTSLSVKPPSVYLNLDGIRLGRNGSISIISLYVAPTAKAYLIAVHGLSSTAFSTANSNSVSLKTILESTAIPKVAFDIRNDSDALFSLSRFQSTALRTSNSWNSQRGQAKSKVCGPCDEWNIEQAKEEWNNEVMWNIRTGDFTLSEDDICVSPA